jgi:hypothetical protein
MNDPAPTPFPAYTDAPGRSDETCGNCGAPIDAEEVLCPSCGALIAAYRAPSGSEIESPQGSGQAPCGVEPAVAGGFARDGLFDEPLTSLPEREPEVPAEPDSFLPGADPASDTASASDPGTMSGVSAPRTCFPAASPTHVAPPSSFNALQSTAGPGASVFPANPARPARPASQDTLVGASGLSRQTPVVPAMAAVTMPVVAPDPRPKQEPQASRAAPATPLLARSSWRSPNERLHEAAKPVWSVNLRQPSAMPRLSPGQLGKIAPFAIIAFIVLANVPGLMILVGLLLVLGIAGVFVCAVLKAAHGTRRRTTDMPRGPGLDRDYRRRDR